MAEESKVGDGDVTDQFEKDLQELVKSNSRYTNHLDFLGPGLTSAAETIKKTKARLLKEAQRDPGLHLMLYASEKNNKMLPWWSNVLHRIAIAQRIIETNVKKQNINLEYVKDMFPNEDETTLQHILTAILYSVEQNVESTAEEKYEIIKALTAEPEPYQRIKQWRIPKRVYIYKCIAGFINCVMCIQNNNAKPKTFIRVAVNDGVYGYFKSENSLIGIESYERLLTARESMKWFAQEVVQALMYDFEWDQAIQWSTYVYKSLTYT